LDVDRVAVGRVSWYISDMATTLLYLQDFNLLEADACIEGVKMDDAKNKVFVILDQTIFYPQGGGQPYDTGVLQTKSGKFTVQEVRFVDGMVRHYGEYAPNAHPGERAHCIVDGERRFLNSRLHSAGHVVDMGVTKLGLGWVPGKGYHFPDGPYVEYTGTLREEVREKLRGDLEAACNGYVEEARATKLVFMPKEEMHKVCHFVPDYLPEGKPARVVMYGDFGVPCGGTHVNNLSEIKKIFVRKLKPEKGNIRVAYDIER